MRGGRPLGFMLRWLQLSSTVGTKEEHWKFDDLSLSLELRKAFREQLKQSEQGLALLAKERKQKLADAAEAEPEEPSTLRGYV